MSRLKLLVTNVGFFGGLKVLSSLFPLLILPYIASKISTDEFGYYDVFTLLGGLLCSISMLGIQDAMFRQFHWKNDKVYQTRVISTGIIIVVISSIIVSCVFLLFKEQVQIAFIENKVYNLVISLSALYVITQNLMNLSIHPSRLLNNKKELLIQTVFFAIIFYSVALILIQFEFGLYALVYAHLLVGITLSILFIIINRKHIFPLKFDWDIAKNLLNIGVPLMPIFIIYWANNSVARILIVKYLDASELGVFAIGSKYASVSTFLQMAFAGGWSYFTFSTMKDRDQVEMKSNIFNVILILIVIFYSLVTPFVPWFYSTFFEGEYIRGYTVFNQLFLSPLFLMLYQIVANQFTIANKSYYSLISLGLGVGLGIIVAFVLAIKGFGISSISYTIPLGYLLSLILASYLAVKQKIFIISYQFAISILFLVVINVIAFKYQNQFLLLVCLLLSTLSVYLWINRTKLKEITLMLKSIL